jgi:hypothetical protein
MSTTRVILCQAAAVLLAVIMFSAANSSLREILTNAGVTVLFLVPGALISLYFQSDRDRQPVPAQPRPGAGKVAPARAPTPARAGPVTVVLNHSGVASDFADGPVLTEDPAITTRPGSPPTALHPVDHPVLAQAATFHCSHCEATLVGGLIRPEVHVERQQAADKARRRRRYWAAVVVTVIWLGYGVLTTGRTGAVATFFAEPWLIIAGPVWLTVVVLSLVRASVDPPDTVIINNLTGEVSHSGRHRLTRTSVRS